MTTRTKKVTALKFWVRIVVEKDESGYHAFAPSLNGLHIGGDTPEEALNNAKEAAELYLKSMLKHGDAIPIDVLEPRVEVNVVDYIL
ncbi:MAG: type II toxin-antitoxin system HicB family antitoxin [Dehalococcoidia bacterium]|nr:type II toxin-antitoxin system HicB family antitoxin [Dehalococcoidia bacterium]